MKILVTGSAGFIGSELCLKLLKHNYEVIGLDNHNDYYDTKLKEDRLKRYINNKKYIHIRSDLVDHSSLNDIFKKYLPDCVVNLAAQAGVRYSIKNPKAFIDSNIYGFTNILECCRHYKVKHLIFASSSSVYGANIDLPYSTDQKADCPLSLYAATKKSNELMAHSYSYLYKLPTTGLRFFTVYGPWGRPDMALFKFTKAIIEKKPIDLFNRGEHYRDFTYIDDVVESIFRILKKPSPSKNFSAKAKSLNKIAPCFIFNIGNSKTIQISEFIKLIEEYLGLKAILNFLPQQPGDMLKTYADTENFYKNFNYKPSTTIEVGIKKFIKWFIKYYNV